MRTILLGGKISVPEIGLGCMRINGLDKRQLESHIRTSIELGVNFFDHADVYDRGECESHFAQSLGMTADLRETMIIQTKCAIRPKVCYDFSKAHILASVDGSLKRLQTDYIDILLLHRPDALMEPEEVADAFSTLKQAGKVRHFGVSNHNPHQIALLNRYLGNNAIIARRTFASRLLQCGVELPVISNMLGHTDKETVQDYISTDDVKMKRCSLNLSLTPYQRGDF